MQQFDYRAVPSEFQIFCFPECLVVDFFGTETVPTVYQNDFFRNSGKKQRICNRRITTTNNYPATIKMVTKKYFPTDWEEAEIGTISSGGREVPLFTSSIPELEEDEIGVRLDVQPSISTNGRTITLPMKPSVREHVGWIDYSYPVTVSVEENVSETFTNIIRMPIFEERVVSTLVSCDDGETIILGGVVHDNSNSVDDQYPILGDIPLIGRLFQSKSKVSEKKNLLIFMTCRLINPDGTPVRESEMRRLPSFRQ